MKYKKHIIAILIFVLINLNGPVFGQLTVLTTSYCWRAWTDPNDPNRICGSCLITSVFNNGGVWQRTGTETCRNKDYNSNLYETGLYDYNYNLCASYNQ